MVNPKPTRLGYQTGPLDLHEGGRKELFGSVRLPRPSGLSRSV